MSNIICPNCSSLIKEDHSRFVTVTKCKNVEDKINEMLEKLIKAFPKSYVVIQQEIGKHSHINNYEHNFTVYISNLSNMSEDKCSPWSSDMSLNDLTTYINEVIKAYGKKED